MQLDFTTQQCRKFTADRESQTRAAVLAAGARVSLLKCLEDQLLLLGSDPDSAIRHRDGHGAVAKS